MIRSKNSRGEEVSTKILGFSNHKSNLKTNFNSTRQPENPTTQREDPPQVNSMATSILKARSPIRLNSCTGPIQGNKSP